MAKPLPDREQIIHQYLHLVKYVADRLSANLPANVDTNDLVNDGVFGLIDAIEKFDAARAVKFETYAIARITGAMLDALRSLDWVPRTVRQRVREVRRAFEGLEFELGRDPTDAELACRLHVSVQELDRVRQRARATSMLSLEEPVRSGDDRDRFVGDTLPDIESDVERALERVESLRELVRAVEALSADERTVIRRYYFKAQTLRKIRDELGISESRVSQIHAQAVVRLRQYLQQAE
ncbi:MAG: FliA/WhiG family RNA polymerase sigma factor [Candidatus Cybelea sp.]